MSFFFCDFWHSFERAKLCRASDIFYMLRFSLRETCTNSEEMWFGILPLSSSFALNYIRGSCSPNFLIFLLFYKTSNMLYPMRNHQLIAFPQFYHCSSWVLTVLFRRSACFLPRRGDTFCGRRWIGECRSLFFTECNDCCPCRYSAVDNTVGFKYLEVIRNGKFVFFTKDKVKKNGDKSVFLGSIVIIQL